MFRFIFTSLLISSHHLNLSASGPESPPAPDLLQLDLDGSSSVVLQCRAPPGHRGYRYRLYRVHTQVDSAHFQEERSYAEFRVKGVAEGPENIYCCQYENSIMSRYTTPRAPTGAATPFPPPLLSVTPPGERVLPGLVLEFWCLAPPPLRGESFTLWRRGWGGHGGKQLVAQSGVPQVRVGPVGWTDGGLYTCTYQSERPDGPRDSAPSSPVPVNITVLPAAVLPAPHLTRDVGGTLVCTGSPSYPGAQFSLFHQGPAPSRGPAFRTQHPPATQHSARFTVPGGRPGEGYQCQYSVLLGEVWVHSELSAALAPLTPHAPPPSKDADEAVLDLPLVAGSVSAALLFLLVLVLLGVGFHRYAKAAAEKKRQRDQDQFWQQVHSTDHIISLTLQRVDATPKDLREEPVYDHPLTTFTQPTHTY